MLIPLDTMRLGETFIITMTFFSRTVRLFLCLHVNLLTCVQPCEVSRRAVYYTGKQNILLLITTAAAAAAAAAAATATAVAAAAATATAATLPLG